MAGRRRGIAVVLAACTFSCIGTAAGPTYVNQWAVHVNGGSEVASEIAEEHGFINRGQIGSLQNHYLFVLQCNQTHTSGCHRRERRDSHTARLDDHADVHWVQQQVRRSRARRRAISPLLRRIQHNHSQQRRSLNFTDPYFSKQWHLHNDKKKHHDINVLAAWKAGYTGRGVVITIVDDGLQHDHPDLIANYDPLASIDLNGGDDDPYPDITHDINRHGTRCAGEIGAAANNGVCGVGVAYNSKIGGVRMLDGDVTDAIEAASLSLNPQHIDIYTNSWGPNDDGRAMEAPAPLAMKAFKAGIEFGRGGKGSLFIFASGNGGHIDNCNADGYANAPFTIAVSAVDEFDDRPYYVEPCAAALASTYSSGKGRAITTTDLNSQCTDAHSGTSAAAPIAAGILALVLEARPELTWRDVQHLMVRTATKNLPTHRSWHTNAVGLNHSHAFGFGMMDAKKLVDAAKTWKLVKPKVVFRTRRYNFNSPFHVFLASNTTLEIVEARGITELEYVQVHAVINARARGDVRIELICPSGTPSILLTNRPDRDHMQIDFTFSTVRCWGESPLGVYRLLVFNNEEVENKDEYSAETNAEPKQDTSTANGDKVVAWGVSVHGTTEDGTVDNYKQRSPDISSKGSTTSFVVNRVPTLDTGGKCNEGKGYFLRKSNVHGDVCRKTANSSHFECPSGCIHRGNASPYCGAPENPALPCRAFIPEAKSCKCTLRQGARVGLKVICERAPTAAECDKLPDVCTTTCLRNSFELHKKFEGTVANIKAKHGHQKNGEMRNYGSKPG